MKKYKHEFTIKRSGWLRGKGLDQSALRLDNGKMCCLGFLAVSCGIKPKQIIGIRSPGDLFGSEYSEKDFGKFRKLTTSKVSFGTINTDTVDDIMIENDIIDEETNREEHITKLFNKIGIKVTFE